jgi:pyrroline-5-carboxylate reductase
MMPNLPTSVSSGANLVFLSDLFKKTERNEVKDFFSTCGNTYFLDSEDQVDIITPFSGSGPALILEFARIFESELARRGDLGVDTRELIVQVFLGTSLLMKNSSLSFLDMRDQVISKKGVTYEAIKVFDEAGLENIFHRAFDSAYRRTLELSKEG